MGANVDGDCREQLQKFCPVYYVFHFTAAEISALEYSTTIFIIYWLALSQSLPWTCFVGISLAVLTHD